MFPRADLHLAALAFDLHLPGLPDLPIGRYGQNRGRFPAFRDDGDQALGENVAPFILGVASRTRTFVASRSPRFSRQARMVFGCTNLPGSAALRFGSTSAGEQTSRGLA